MSAYLCDEMTFSLLAHYWARGKTDAEARDSLDCAIRQARALAPPAETLPTAWDLDQAAGSPVAAVFGVLVLENLRSLAARYPYLREEHRREAEGLELLALQASDLRPEVSGRVAAAVAELDYQSCEHDGWGRSVASHLLDQMRCKLLRDLQAIATPQRVSHG
jgi:hypothetical protein